MFRVDVYGARECHLCEEAMALLQSVAAELELDVHYTDITGVPELEAQHRAEIPTVFIDGRKAFKYRVDERELRRRVRRARDSRS